MSGIILHLGLAKTGTSWLQKKVFPKLDVDYYHCGHYEVLNKTRCNDKPLLLSYEGFSGTIACNDRFINAYRLHKIFPSAKILLMTRDKKRYVNSLYSQHIKNGGIHDKEWFVNIINVHPYFMNWDLYIKYLKRLWGDEKVKIMKFEDMKYNQLEYVWDICRFIGVDVPDDIDLKPVNKSLSQRQRVIWRWWNQWFKSKWNTHSILPKWMNPCFIYKNMEGFFE